MSFLNFETIVIDTYLLQNLLLARGSIDTLADLLQVNGWITNILAGIVVLGICVVVFRNLYLARSGEPLIHFH